MNLVLIKTIPSVATGYVLTPTFVHSKPPHPWRNGSGTADFGLGCGTHNDDDDDDDEVTDYRGRGLWLRGG